MFIIVIGLGNFTDSIEKITLFFEHHLSYAHAKPKSSEAQDEKQVNVSPESTNNPHKTEDIEKKASISNPTLPDEIRYSDDVNQALKLDCSKNVCIGSPEAMINHINHYISIKSPANENERKKLIDRWLAKYKDVREELYEASTRAQGEEAAIALDLGHIDIAVRLIGELINNQEYGGGTGYDGWLHKIKGDLLWLQSSNAEAATSYRKAVEISGDYRYEYAEALEDIGRKDEAEIMRRTQQVRGR